MSVPIARTVDELKRTVAEWRSKGESIAVVPTMGALHAGHLSLVQAALDTADRVIVTLFVNPKQFNSAADLAAYPRTEKEDAAKLTPLGAHLLYCPDGEEMYPAGFATTVSVSGVSEGLCGAYRPGHYADGRGFRLLRREGLPAVAGGAAARRRSRHTCRDHWLSDRARRRWASDVVQELTFIG